MDSAPSSRFSPPRNSKRFRNRKVAVHVSPQDDVDTAKPHCSSSGGGGAPPQKKNEPRKPRQRQQKKGGSTSKRRQEADISPDEMARIVALDCEMVGVGDGGVRSALARATVVDWTGEVIFDAYVKVDEPVTDYRTFVSGVREEHILEGGIGNAMDLDACREAVASLIRGRVLVGHGLKNDLQALRIRHPWHDTRDTAKYEPFMKTRFEDGVLWPRKLKDLTREKLSRTIQVEGREHSPVEDAVAALELYKKVRTKWEKVVEYKVKKTREIMSQQQQQ